MRSWSKPAVDLTGLRTPFVIVGGVATALYMPQRMTLDLGVLVVAGQAAEFHRELLEHGFVRESALDVGGSRWQSANGDRLAVLESAEAWVSDAVGAPNRSPTGLPVVALPYLVMIKLDASRAQDIADVSRMMALADEPTRERVREAVGRYRGLGDVDDVNSLTALGELELIESENEP